MVELLCLKAQGAILPEMTSLMTSSWQNSIGFILTRLGTILWSFIKIEQDLAELSCLQAKGRFYRKWRHCDVTDDVIITKFNRVHPYPPRNNPGKFHQDRIRFTRVMVFTRKCWQTDRRQTDIMITIPLVLPRGKNRHPWSLTISAYMMPGHQKLPLINSNKIISSNQYHINM